jgi:enamine deaminase RidA (YjgF/YER057c/UK114 family)
MKEKIYTIPVTDAFREDCECPLCVLERKLEDEYVEYILGPFLMEPEGRIETNENGFCRKHFEMLYKVQSKRHGLALILDTHLIEQNKKFKKMYDAKLDALLKNSEISLVKSLSNKITSKQTESEKLVDQLISELSNLENKCTVCSKLNFTMDRYIDVTLYLWFKEEDFRELFNSKKGFCMKHFKVLLEGTKKHLNARETAVFVENLLKIQVDNMQRVQEEVNWFTKKFDYRYNDEPWGNSKDAVPRSIQKIAGYCDLK